MTCSIRWRFKKQVGMRIFEQLELDLPFFDIVRHDVTMWITWLRKGAIWLHLACFDLGKSSMSLTILSMFLDAKSTCQHIDSSLEKSLSS